MKLYTLRLSVRAPILTQATAIGAVGIDSPVARDEDGTPYVAGSHVTGKLRQALLELKDAACKVNPQLFSPDVEAWFGPQKGDLGAGAARKIVLISDLRAVETCPKDVLRDARAAAPAGRTRVAIDDVRGAALEGALQTLEMPFPAGTTVVFEGAVRILAPDDAAEKIACALERGLNWIPQLGGERTVGFGRLRKVEWSEVRSREPQRLCLSRDGRPVPERWRLVLRFLEPFCIAKPHRQGNLFESEEIVPGGVIKGALAALMVAEADAKRGTTARELRNHFPTLAKHFDDIRVSHLFPARLEAGAGRHWLEDLGGGPCAPLALRRATVMPLSLVRDARGRLYDVATCEGPGLLDGRAPSFAVDWKGDDDARALFGWASPRTTLRVRTGMDFERRAAETEKLFAYEMIVPDDHLWIGELDLQRVKDEAERLALLEELSGLVKDGLAGIGKTLATAQLLLLPIEKEAPRPPKRRRETHILTLQTPALLCTPDDMRGADAAWASAAGRLAQGYRKTFRELSKGALELVRHFAEQRLAGGQHYAARFMSDRPYQPWVLTQPGSVFVLKVVPGRAAQARKELDAWARGGLCIADRIWKAYAPQPDKSEEAFERCPFLPENGYGEVAVDLPQHDALAPGDHFQPLQPGAAA